eukprot:1726406-Prymnesium_polylepis.1
MAGAAARRARRAPARAPARRVAAAARASRLQPLGRRTPSRARTRSVRSGQRLRRHICRREAPAACSATRRGSAAAPGPRRQSAPRGAGTAAAIAA